jgi:transposase, putative, N-terminal domain
MITLQCQLEFQNKQDKKTVLDLMRKFSSAMRYAYKRLLEGEKRKDLKKELSKLFNINTRYSDDAVLSAQSMITSCQERGQNPNKVIFGSRKLFEQLKKNHLTGKRRKQLKAKWKESRQENLYSRGIDVNAYPFHLALAFALPKGKRGLGFKEKQPKNYKELLNDTDFLSYTIARIEDNIKKLKQKLKEEKNEYKRNKIKSKLAKLRKNLKTLQNHVSRFTSHVSRLESGKSKSATQQPVNQRKQQMRGLPTGRHKSWQVLSIALAFCCLERSYRDFSPLKRVIISKDWTAVANRLTPACLAAGTMTLPKYRLLGSEVSEMAEYKYPNPSCARFA